MKKLIVIILSVILLTTPLLINAELISEQQLNRQWVPATAMDLESLAKSNAKKDAKNTIDCDSWLMVGCLFGLFGVISASLIEPSPNISYLIGKSPEYVSIYTKEYKKIGSNIQAEMAIRGCLISSVICGLYFIIPNSSLNF